MDHPLDELLAHADRRTLAAVVTHLTGDPQAITDLGDRASIEAAAARIVPRYLGGAPVPEPSDTVLQAAMDLAVGRPVPPAYRDFAREQAGFGPIEAPAPITAPAGFRVLIIGAGVTGLAIARAFADRGFHDIVVVDRNEQPGGTWWQNTYPGCRVDTPSLLYSFSFERGDDWPEHFSRQPAVLDYLRGVAERFELGDRLRLSTSVTALRWDEAEARWHAEVDGPDGLGEIVADVVAIAPGLLRIPKLPAIAGRSSFSGPAFHSAEWDHDVELAGRRVAVIGTGASAQQIVPAIAGTAAEVLVFQRSPQWLTPHANYGKRFDGIERAVFEELPAYKAWSRFAESWRFGDGVTPFVQVDPDWPHQARSVNADNERMRRWLVDYIHEQVGDQPELLAKVLPDYPPYGKRMLIDNGWYRALRRDDVHLITDHIEALTSDGVRTSARHHPVDVIVYATGFDADRYLWPVATTGRDGVDLVAQLHDRPEAYLGVALGHAPNLFLCPGPNGYLGHAGSAILFAECHARYVAEWVRTLCSLGARTMEVRPEAIRQHTDMVAAQLEGFVQSAAGIDNWFRGERDRIVTIAATSVLDFWLAYRTVDVDAYLVDGERSSGDRPPGGQPAFGP